jgi:spore maturation protein CgeB
VKEDMGRLFKVGEEVVCFSSIEELKKEIGHYLKHPDERAEIARAAHRRAVGEHTYDHRAREILERVKAVR